MAPISAAHAVYALALILSLGMIGAGAYLAHARGEYGILAAGGLSLIAVLISWPLAIALARSQRMAVKLLDEKFDPIAERFQQFSVMIDLLSEQQLISDRAKAVAFREKDRDAIRRAIQEEMIRQDWEAGLALCQDMETLFGYKQEADRCRASIIAKRQEVVRRQIADATLHVDRQVRAEQWQQAHREAERVMQQFPDEESVQRLPQEIENRRQQHKVQLLSSWSDAVTRKDVDGGIEILKKLDHYLTPAEAEGLQETARNVFKEKLNNLRSQFSAAVQEHKWIEAVRVGDVIIRDFPNTQIAKEVRENIETLRQRAAGKEPELARA